MPGAKKKSNALTKAGKKNIAFLESKQLKDATKKNVDFIAKKKKINALDAAIMKQKPLKSKNKNPGRYLDK